MAITSTGTKAELYLYAHSYADIIRMQAKGGEPKCDPSDGVLLVITNSQIKPGTYYKTVVHFKEIPNWMKEGRMPKEKPVANAYFVERELLVTFTNGRQIVLRRNQFKELRRGLNALNKKLEAEKPPKRYTSLKNGTGTFIIDSKGNEDGILYTYERTDPAVVKTILKALNREDKKRNTVTPGFKEI